MLERFLLLWLLLTSGVAYFFPEPLVATKVTLPWLITITMFSIGLMLPRDEVRQVFLRWPTVFAGTALQYAVMPLLAFGMGKAFGLTGDAFIGIVVVGCVPGAMASNVLTLNARGNTSYSVSLTTAATFLSPIAVPLVLALALQSKDGVDVAILWNASKVLVTTVVVPVLIGHLLSRRFPNLETHSQRYGAIVANLAILWIIAVVVAISRSQLEKLRVDLFGALLAVNLLGYVAGYAGGWGMRLPEPMRRALTLEVGMQNAGLGAALAVKLFPDQTGVAIAPAIYTFGCMLTGTMLAHMWARSSGSR
ncbi:MAG: bile acid:sodium symporter family protein [Planctomycetaceae bacterium]|nr:bile acid:sodium symporter family protein [Planctomycetales bacterium]MCB9875242.1 bile acid:sodium symporter family protein [Planctomycetaceae bacterium]MCB9938862.1 bile acid:sodium symporter family protein [Planctomycetaceae bacterium]